MKYILVLIYLFSHINLAVGQSKKTYNYFTFFYVDNGASESAEMLNSEMVSELKDRLQANASKGDNFFYFYGCNGKEPKQAVDAETILTSDSFKKYISKKSKESEHNYDKKLIRQFFVEHPLAIVAQIECNLFISASMMQRIIDTPEELSAPITLINEIGIYLTSNNEIATTRVNIYIDRAILEENSKLNEESIKSYFSFYSSELNSKKIIFEINII